MDILLSIENLGRSFTQQLKKKFNFQTILSLAKFLNIFFLSDPKWILNTCWAPKYIWASTVEFANGSSKIETKKAKNSQTWPTMLEDLFNKIIERWSNCKVLSIISLTPILHVSMCWMVLKKKITSKLTYLWPSF